jgi:hypothetical protein
MNVRYRKISPYTSNLNKSSGLSWVSIAHQGAYIGRCPLLVSASCSRFHGRLTYPPMSTTITSLSSLLSMASSFASKAAPRAEFVGPEAKHLTGYLVAVDALQSVPSLSVMYNLHRSNFFAAHEKPAMTCFAKRRRLAFKIVAFSLSRKPSRPI